MGGGCYSYVRDCATKAGYVGESCEQVFTARHMSPDMNICGKVRECRDSDEHPTTYPIIIALDVTGSMGSIPHNLITGGFPAIMKKIMDEGIEHPQVCFLGIGDDYYDEAPIQAGQFEASDELLDHWLKSLWIEGGGGGNDGQSEVLLDGFVPEIICGAICKHLDYDPDAVYYNDSVESNIKEVEV